MPNQTPQIEKDNTFAVSVRFYTDALWVAYSARHIGTAIRTLQYWRAGTYQPSRMAQEGILLKLKEEYKRVCVLRQPRYKYEKRKRKG